MAVKFDIGQNLSLAGYSVVGQGSEIGSRYRENQVSISGNRVLIIRKWPKMAKIPIGRAVKQEEKGLKQGKISQNPYSESQNQTKMPIFTVKKDVLAYEPLLKVPFSA